MLDARPTEQALCKFTSFRRIYQPSETELQAIANEIGHVDAVLTSVSDKTEATAALLKTITGLFPATPLLQFKNIFGEGHTSYGLGVYAAAQILKHQKFPKEMLIEGSAAPTALKRILVLNNVLGRDYTFTVLEA